jgi:hypothetical protein
VLFVFRGFDFSVDFPIANFGLRSDISARILDLGMWFVSCLSLVTVIFEFLV